MEGNTGLIPIPWLSLTCLSTSADYLTAPETSPEFQTKMNLAMEELMIKQVRSSLSQRNRFILFHFFVVAVFPFY
jgi:hypothetical protein